jgi:hypothetical protein
LDSITLERIKHGFELELDEIVGGRFAASCSTSDSFPVLLAIVNGPSNLIELGQ